MFGWALNFPRLIDYDRELFLIVFEPKRALSVLQHEAKLLSFSVPPVDLGCKCSTLASALASRSA
jgi:hypothetical protein